MQVGEQVGMFEWAVDGVSPYLGGTLVHFGGYRTVFVEDVGEVATSGDRLTWVGRDMNSAPSALFVNGRPLNCGRLGGAGMPPVRSATGPFRLARPKVGSGPLPVFPARALRPAQSG